MAADSVSARTAADEELVSALQQGSEKAFEQLVRTHGGRMLSVARRLLGDEELARDAVQEAFLNAYRSIDRFRGQAGLGTWLHRIVVNAALTATRRQRSRPEHSIEPLLPTFLEDGHQADPASEWPDDVVERAEVKTAVRAAIGRLPESHRAVLILRDIEEMTTAEAADALGISEGATKVRLHRARQALRQEIDREIRDTGRPQWTN